MARRTVADILEKAADILEKRGFTTSECYNPETGGYCALGAIARSAYPKAKNADIDEIAYHGVDNNYGQADPRYVVAVQIAAATIQRRRKTLPDAGLSGSVVYGYNDRAKSPKQVVKMLRRAAENARKAAAR